MSMRPVHRRYHREFLPAMAAYVVLLVVSVWLLGAGVIEGRTPRTLIALLPALPILFVIRAILRFVRDADELERRIELETIAIATAIVAQLYFIGGLLQSAKTIDVNAAAAMLWVLPMLFAMYGIVKFFVSKRYG